MVMAASLLSKHHYLDAILSPVSVLSCVHSLVSYYAPKKVFLHS